MKRYKLSYLLPAALLLCITSCDTDQLPEGGTITSSQKEQVQGSDASKLNADVNALSAALIKYGAISDWAGRTNHFDFGFASACMMYDASGMDMPSENTGYNWYRTQLLFTDRTDTGSNTYFFWNMFYSQIKIANDLIKQLDAINSTESAFNRYRGQALASRAWAYLNLVQIYQFTYKGHEEAFAVPIVTEKTTPEQERNNPRATVKDVYTLIMEDLTTAISLLTTERNGKDQININVAYGLRARANLLMQKWEDAANDADKAIAGYTPYTIKEVSKPSFNSSAARSWIWGNIVTETNDIVKSGIINFPSQMCSFTGNGYSPGYAGRYINSKLYNEIPDSDVRKGWWAVADTIYDPKNPGKIEEFDFTTKTPHVDWEWYYTYKGVKYNVADWLGWQAPYVNVKFGPYQDEYNNPTNACDFPMMRVEEMYLIKAEGLAMGGNLGEGKKVLEDFLKNYRDPNFASKAASAEEFQDEVWFQRRIELWGEGFSFFDMMRLKKPLDRTGANFPTAAAFNLPAESKIFLWIIPEDEIESNEGISKEDNNEIVPAPKA